LQSYYHINRVFGDNEWHLLGRNAQELVKYCQEKQKRMKEGLKIELTKESDEQVVEDNFVRYKDKKYYVTYNTLDLHRQGVKDITEIEGLEHLTNLQILDLSWNQIEDIKGLEHLKNLKELHLFANHVNKIKGLESLTKLEILDLRDNHIEEIEGLEHLNDLRKLYLGGNPIKNEEHYLIGRPAQEIVRYAQEKEKKRLRY
jgi:hypothetical protein